MNKKYDRKGNFNMKKKTLVLIIFIIAILLIIFSYVSLNNENNTNLQNTSLRLKWICQAQFAGYYTANAEKYYEEEWN